MKEKLIWCWSSDGMVLNVFRVYQTKYLKRWKMKRIACFMDSSFTDPEAVAEDFIKRYMKGTDIECPVCRGTGNNGANGLDSPIRKCEYCSGKGLIMANSPQLARYMKGE